MPIDNDILKIIVNLTEGTLGPNDRRRALLDFARINGWRPSDIEDYPAVADLAKAHLVVEHGLDPSVVISFLTSNMPYSHLPKDSQFRLLGLSYNNLIDWHFFPDKGGLCWVFNRSNPPTEGRLFVEEDPNSWSAQAFDKIVGRKPNPNVKALDDALITTISDWRRRLAQDVQTGGKTAHLTLLFNSILFVRALEDTCRSQGMSLPQELLNTLWKDGSPKLTFGACVTLAFRQLGIDRYPSVVLGDQKDLAAFDGLNGATVQQLLADFYRNRYCEPYRYDFSVMSKHALSRIYEHYVTLLRDKDSPQMTMFPDLPEEVKNKALGGIYTPQYIARFFAKYLKDNHTPPAFRSLHTADPACGSGIFSRTLLELQCDPLQDIDVQTVSAEAFKNIFCLDVDGNACQATRLSLALLHLVLTREIPKALNVIEHEALDYYAKHDKHLRACFDAVMANPPFVKWDRMVPLLRSRCESFLGKQLTHGKIDAYLAHLELGLRLVKPGGYVLYVLPHAFLLGANASKLRKRIAGDFWIRVVADISDIPVFDAGSYVILLILQRKQSVLTSEPAATIVKCKEFVGQALQDALENRLVDNEFYTVYNVPQSSFSGDEWYILPPRHFSIMTKVSRTRRLDEFLEVREGFITGADDVFIRNRKEVPPEDKGVWKPYLPDRDMKRYSIPRRLEKVVFYPYRLGVKLSLSQLQEMYPKTWKYLQASHKKLSRRASVSRSSNPWWAPVRARSPKHMLRPKIVSPHLASFPKFAVDCTGEVMVSHGPYMYPKAADNTDANLRYFAAVLNSRVFFWQMTHLSHKYARGYLMLEKKTVDPLRVPAPESVPLPTMIELQNLVERRLAGDEAVEKELDRIVCNLYGLTDDEIGSLG